ncbi:hypothetical protein DID88_005462 [Monilinia fructigena]|uniref:Uncharacterized protein n=1 Tax=Monilinia fructigena TaxID=38457 RepID=A0A395IZU5_9HELO|nr:hypothetical protein DID88_005462 [Monilinia fructigena]
MQTTNLWEESRDTIAVMHQHPNPIQTSKPLWHPKRATAATKTPTNTTKLEFSNYAQIDVKRRGTKALKRYEFEYWGHSYSWKRVMEKDGEGKAISYHLFKEDSTNGHRSYCTGIEIAG